MKLKSNITIILNPNGSGVTTACTKYSLSNDKVLLPLQKLIEGSAIC